MDKQGQEYQWLEWAKELQFIAQAGLTFTKDLFDKERFERIRENISRNNEPAKQAPFVGNKRFVLQ